MYVREFGEPVIDAILFSPLHVVGYVHYIFHRYSGIECTGCIVVDGDVSVVYEMLGGKV